MRPVRPVTQTPGSAEQPRSFDEPSIHLRLDQPLMESHERSFAKRGLIRVYTIQDQLPAPIHHCCLNDLIIRNPHIRLQYERQRQHRRRHWRLSSLCFSIQTRQLLLKRFIQQFVAMLTQKDKQFGFANFFDNLLFLS